MTWFAQEEFLRDPYPHYARLRAEKPIHDVPGLGWTILSYRDIAALSRDARLSNAVTPIYMRRVPPALRWACRDLEATLNGFLLFSDPPRHTRLKAALSPLLTPGAVRRQEERIRGHVRRLLPESPGRWDFMSGLADRLPPLVIADVLGLPEVEPILNWSNDLTAFVVNTSATPEAIMVAAQAATTMDRYFTDLAGQRRREPRDDLTSDLVASGLDDAEVAILASVLVAAGHDTTAGLLGNTVLALLDHPGEWEALIAAPEGLDAVIEEGLRYDGPSHTTPRVVREDFVYEGNEFRTGEVVHLFVAAANRDPEKFERVDDFWPDRPGNRHFAFSWGPHFCAGAFLARLQARVVLQELTGRFPQTRRAAPVERRLSLALRQLGSLPLELA